MIFLQKAVTDIVGEEPSPEELKRHYKIMEKSQSGDVGKLEALKFFRGLHIKTKLKSLMGASYSIMEQQNRLNSSVSQSTVGN